MPSWCSGSTAISQDPGNSHRKVESVIQGLEIWTRKGKKGLFREYSRGQSGYRQGLQKGMGSQVRIGPKGRTFGPLLAGQGDLTGPCGEQGKEGGRGEEQFLESNKTILFCY